MVTKMWKTCLWGHLDQMPSTEGGFAIREASSTVSQCDIAFVNQPAAAVVDCWDGSKYVFAEGLPGGQMCQTEPQL